MAEVIICKTKKQAADEALRIFSKVYEEKNNLVLGLATGATPLPFYERLASWKNDNNIDLSRMRGFALDEYVGIDPSHPQSYHSVINVEVTLPLGLNPALINVPDGSLANIQTTGQNYERMIIEAGGVDIQILGIGTNGHIAFNEPGSSLASRTRIKTLTPKTRQDNARFFDDISQVPTHCVTQGVATILAAKKIILFAFGKAKAKALAYSLEGAVTASVPGSALQLHEDVVVICDDDAAAELKFKDYYNYTFQNKPF